MKGERKATSAHRRMARALFIYLQVVAAGEEGSKDTKLCMNYDVIYSLLAHHLGRPSKSVSSGFFSKGLHQHLPPNVSLKMLLSSYITHK